MDKETLSNYGWIVICVLVLAVMLGLATPFGSFISTAVKDTTAGLFATNQKALDIAGIPIANQSFNTTDENGKAKLEADKPTKIDEDTTTLVVGNKEIPVNMPAGTIIDMDEDGNATVTAPSKEPEVPAAPAPTIELINFTVGELKTVTDSSIKNVKYDEYYDVSLFPSVIVTKNVTKFLIDESTGKVTAKSASLSDVNDAKELQWTVNGTSLDHKPNYISYRTINNNSNVTLKGVQGNSLEFSYAFYTSEDTENAMKSYSSYKFQTKNVSYNVARKSGNTYIKAYDIQNLKSLPYTETRVREATKQIVLSPSSKTYIPTDVLTAEKGMTWNQWIDSKYNTEGITKDTAIKDKNGNTVDKNAKISNGEEYIIKAVSYTHLRAHET